MPRIVKTVCSHDCPDTCSVLITLDDRTGEDRAIQFRGDPDHPITAGFLCGKVNSYERLVYSDDRVLRPQRRVGRKGEGRFEPISWDEALETIAGRIRQCRDELGGESLLQHYYGGTLGQINRRCGDALFHRLGATRVRRNICYYGASAGYEAVVGPGHGIDPEDVAHSDLILVWGCNVVTTQVHLMRFIDTARKNGARVVAIDPYRNRTARIADEWIPIRPGTDTVLALAMMHVIEKEGLLDDEFINERTVGFDELSSRVLPRHDPASASTITGVPADTIVDLARRFANAEAPCIKVGVGLGRSSHGGAAVRSVCCLAGVVGSFDKLGGGVQYDTGCEFRLATEAVTRPDWLQSPTRTLNMTDLAIGLEEWQDPPLRFLWFHSSNPAATSPLQTRLCGQLERDDIFTVVHEIFLTDTARYADILLPATPFPECSDLYTSYGHLYLQYGARALSPRGESKSNLEVVQMLARELGLDDPWFERSPQEHVRALLDSDDPNLEGVDADRVLAGEVVRLNLPRRCPGFADGFRTPSGKLEFASASLAAKGLPAVVDYHGDPFNTRPEEHPLRLITPPAHSFCNSSFGYSELARRREKGEPNVLVHPDDAGDIESGDEVELFNENGRLRILATVTTDTRPGTVVAEGTWWPMYGRDGKGINVLTSNRLTDLGGGSTFHDNRVGIRKL